MNLRTLAVFLSLCPLVRADVTLPAFFADHAVLQRDKPLPIWGWAAAGEAVTVSLGAQKATATTGADGRWMVRLGAQKASKEPLTLTVEGGNTVTVKNVLLGDVWLCSGQSNMDMALGGCDAPQDVKAADFQLIRHFRTEYNFASAPASDVKGRWSVCSPGSASGFSAVGFYFARKIHAETGVPIGLLTNAVGGTNIELWISEETLLGTPALDSYAKQMRESLADYQKQLAASLGPMEKWIATSRDALNAGREVPMPPRFPDFPFGEKMHRPRCVTLFNGHIAPLAPMAMRGVIWYQGENNADGTLYVEKKAAMLGEWRRLFEDPGLPFYFVQLASFLKPNDNPADVGWGAIRDAQRRCLAIPHTGMASAVDVGDADDIHPKNKADVGERLALWALAGPYGKSGVVASGPLFEKLTIEGGKARISFTHTGGGLMVARKDGRAPAVEDKASKLRRFAICGADKKWVWADAVIDRETVVVSSPEVAEPVAVRYAFGSNPEGANLYNRAGLPASPFSASR